MSDRTPAEEGELELDERFDEQKRKVDEWTKDRKREHDEAEEREPSWVDPDGHVGGATRELNI